MVLVSARDEKREREREKEGERMINRWPIMANNAALYRRVS